MMLNMSVATVGVDTWAADFAALSLANCPRTFIRT